MIILRQAYQIMTIDDFAITITLMPEYSKLHSKHSIYNEIREILHEVFASLEGHYDYVLTCELTKQNIPHWHAYLVYLSAQKMTKIRKQIMDKLNIHNKFGFIKIKRVFDASNWLAYMHKNEYKPDQPLNLFDE